MKRLYAILVMIGFGCPGTLLAQCDINELVVEATACDNGQFSVHLDFNVVNPNADNFHVTGNGHNYGTFPYNSLPVIIGPLAGDGVTEWEFVVTDVENEDCQAAFVLGVVQCCGFNEVVIDPTECANLEVFSAVLNFNHFGTGGLGFDVFDANGMPIGFFEYVDLPVTVNGIPSVSGGFTHITICDNDNEDCCRTIEFEGLDCDNDDCEISNVDILIGECENGQFYVTLGFNYMNVGPTFSVQGNGHNYGTFEYTELPIAIGPLDGDGETIYEFVVADTQFDNCSDFAVIDPVTCPGGCGFHEVNIDPVECQGDGHYTLGINFVPVGTGDQFSVYSHGVLLGSFLYDDLPVFIDSFPASCNDFDVITICDHADPTCCATHEFLALHCCPNCHIYDLTAETTECDSNGMFYVELDFEFENVSEEGFTVVGNGHNYGLFDYDDVPIILGPFEGNGNTNYEFGVMDLVHNDCSDAIELGFVNCSVCGFHEIVVDVLECTGNGLYALSLNFVPVNTTNDGFDVYAGDHFIGFFLYSNLPVVIEHFPDGDGPVDVITICDNDNPGCCTSKEFEENLSCGACHIFELQVDVSDCDTLTNTFAVTIDFGWTGAVEVFDIYKGDHLIASVEGADLPVTIDGLTDDGGGALFEVCAHNIPDCCAHREVAVPQCGVEPCDITALVAEAFACDTATQTFSLYIDLEWTGNDNEFHVFKNGVPVGAVNGAHLPDTLHGLTDDGGGALITVCSVSHPDCCASVEISVPDCGACEIFEVVADPGVCTGDSTFVVAITYEFTGFQNEFVDVWTGDTYLGFFHVDVQPIIIEDFPWNGHNVMPLRICQNDHPDCCRTIEFEVPGCLYQAECGINELVVDLLGCDSDSTFAAFVNFNAIGFDGPVQIWTGDVYHGVFPQDLPVLVMGIPENGGGIVLTVCQAENMDCCAEIEFQGMICDNVGAIGNLTVSISACDEGMFMATLDFDFENVSDSFGLKGNGSFYGYFSYDRVPLTLGPFAGDNETHWEFAVSDHANPALLDQVDVGFVDCTTGIPDAFAAKSFLEIRYGDDGVSFICPPDAKEFTIWTYDGKMIYKGHELIPGERVWVSGYLPTTGLYFISVRATDKIYAGKIVEFTE